MPTKSKKSSVATSKKKGGILSRINFSSRKTQFITVTLIVGLMGAGWFTFRSFAAETVSIANVSNANLVCRLGSTGCSTPKEEKKNGMQVIDLKFGSKSISTNDFATFSLSSNWVEVCFYATSPGSVASATIRDRSNSRILAADKKYTISGDYKWYCMDRVPITSKQLSAGKFSGVSLELTNAIQSGNSIRVSSVQAKIVPIPIVTNATPTK